MGEQKDKQAQSKAAAQEFDRLQRLADQGELTPEEAREALKLLFGPESEFSE